MAKKRKRMDPNSIPVLTKKLDKIFSKFVRLSHVDQDGLIRCYTCPHRGALERMQAGHFIPRQYRATRWELWNVKPQCFSCNMYYNGRPQEFRARLVEEMREEKVKELELLRHSKRTFTRFELKEMIDSYTKKVKQLLSDQSK